MQDSLISQGLDLMMFGMGAVLAFLTLLVLVMMAMSATVRRLLPEAEPVPLVEDDDTSPAPAVDARIVQVIQLAIQQHRAKRGG